MPRLFHHAAPSPFAPEVPARSMRRQVKQWLLRARARLAVGLNKSFGPRAGEQFGILMYHRVADLGLTSQSPTYNVTPARFRRQLEGLQHAGFVFWPLRKLIEFHRRGWPVPPYVTTVTFDDGYRGVYQHALPVLRELRIPATLFLATGYLDRDEPFPFERWGLTHADAAAPDAVLPLTTKQCRELVASGWVDVGSHTHWHHDYRARIADFETDLRQSVDVVHSLTGLSEVLFAFPYGTPSLGFASDALIAAARAGGVVCALNTAARLSDPTDDPFHWGRFDVFESDDSETLSAKLAGWNSEFFRSPWQAEGKLSPAINPTSFPTHAPPHPVAARSHKPLVSVIVPTFNRAHWLSAALESLIHQETHNAFDLEIVVVNNASTDGTADVLAGITETSPTPIQSLFQVVPGDAPTRNLGVQAARGEWLAFFDDDQIATPDWLYELYQAALRTDGKIVGGPVHLDLTADESRRLGPLCRRVLREIDFYPRLQPYLHNHIPGTGNALVARSVFDELGQFDERMRTGGSDSDFFMRARRAGYSSWYCPSAIIRHRIAPNRLTAEYLRWDSLMGGAEHAAHFDLKHRGKLRTVGICALRLTQALAWNLPKLAWATLRGDEAEALGRRTLLWRAEGYARKTLVGLFPRLLPQTQFFEWLDFRNGRIVGATAGDAAGLKIDECVATVAKPCEYTAGGRE